MTKEETLVSDGSKDNLERSTSLEVVESASIVTVPSTDVKSDELDLPNSIARKSGVEADWPLTEIKEPHKNDVLYGRGGGTNHHPGNKRYRVMVERRKVDYVNSKRLDKPLVAYEIIKEWRTQDPPGRFLKMDENTGMWCDVGDKKAREKTSQALREKAPQLRKQQGDVDCEEVDGISLVTYTQFDVSPKKRVDIPLTLQRDHSLGRDYLETTEKVAVEDFSWNSGLAREDIPIRSFDGSWPRHQSELVQEGPPMDPYGDMSSPARIQRHSHPHGVNPPYTTSIPHTGSNGWPVPEGNTLSPVRSAQVGGEYKWPPQSVQTIPGNDAGSPAHWVSGEFRKDMTNIQIPHDRECIPMSDARRRPDEGNGVEDIERHHFSQVVDILDDPDQNWRGAENGPVLRNNSYPDYHRGDSIPAEYDTWASPSRTSSQVSDSGGGNSTPRRSNKYDISIEPITGPDDDPFSPQSISAAQGGSNNHFGDKFQRPEFMSNHVAVSPSEGSSPSKTPRNNVSSPRHRRQTNTRNHSHNSTPARRNTCNTRKSPSSKSETPYYQPDAQSDRVGTSSLPKPPPVKRDTSNQNENSETKPSVKRMNRQRSLGSRVQNQLYKVSEKEVTSLGNCLEQSSLENDVRIHGYSDEPRNYTSDKLERPTVIKSTDRERTIDSFDIAIENNLPSIERIGGDEGNLDYENERKTDFPFLDHDSSEGNCQTSLNLTYPPPFLSISDRLSSLGSVEGLDTNDDFANTGRVEAN